MTDAATKRPLIWLVDDDPDCLEIGRRALEGAGFRVSCAFGPDEALARLDAGRPDLIVTDLMMDAIDAGFAFARRVREDPRLASVPIVVTTAIESRMGFDFRPRAPADLSAMQVDAFLPKPTSSRSLVEAVKSLLARQPAR